MGKSFSGFVHSSLSVDQLSFNFRLIMCFFFTSLLLLSLLCTHMSTYSFHSLYIFNK